MSSVSLIIKAVAEIAVVLLLIWGIINESKLVRIEKKIFKMLKNLRKKRRAVREAEMKNELRAVKYKSEYETERKSSDKPKKKSHHGKVA